LAGDASGALKTITAMEELMWGRERATPEMGLVERLRIFKAGHLKGASVAFAMAESAKQRFRRRNPLYYLDAVSAYAWAERQAHGTVSQETRDELRLLDMPELAGKKAALLAQGFL
jgi:hypothetical protein